MGLPTRIYHAATLEVAQTVSLTAESSHHVAQVLRMQVGEPLVLFNHSGFDFIGKITRVQKNQVTVLIEQRVQNHTESPLQLHLCQALVRNEKMDWVIQKAVELGATHFTPVATSHCQVHLSKEKHEKKYAHWQGIIEHATAQTGRAYLMQLHPLISFQEWCVKTAEYTFCLHPESTQAFDAVLKAPVQQGLRFLIGPEGGLSDDEIEAANAAGIPAYRFGPRVLRTETAGLAVLSALQAALGDLR